MYAEKTKTNRSNADRICTELERHQEGVNAFIENTDGGDLNLQISLAPAKFGDYTYSMLKNKAYTLGLKEARMCQMNWNENECLDIGFEVLKQEIKTAKEALNKQETPKFTPNNTINNRILEMYKKGKFMREDFQMRGMVITIYVFNIIIEITD